MFSQVSVCLSTGRDGYLCSYVLSGGWLSLVPGNFGGEYVKGWVSMVVGGWTWNVRGYAIGWYASYWNAYLLKIWLTA